MSIISGEIKTSLGELIDAKSIEWKRYDAKKQKYKSKKCGHLLIKYANIIKKHSFTSFLSGGLEIQLMVAIDFTGSNGIHSLPLSRCLLHALLFFDIFRRSVKPKVFALYGSTAL